MVEFAIRSYITNEMPKKILISALTAFFFAAILGCNGTTKATESPPLSLAEKDMTGEWCFEYSWNADTILRIALMLDSVRHYEMNVIINGTDTSYAEDGAWRFVSVDGADETYSVMLDASTCEPPSATGDCAGISRTIPVVVTQDKWQVRPDTLCDGAPDGRVPAAVAHLQADFFHNTCIRQIPPEDAQVAGVWRYGMQWKQDTTLNIVMSFDSLHGYSIDVDINGTDTVESETGTWTIAGGAVSGRDTVWMERKACKRINAATHELDSVDCGIPVAGIGLSLGNNGTWRIPLSDFAKYLPTGILPGGLALPPVAFVKDP
jgi:hypothetical protein